MSESPQTNEQLIHNLINYSKHGHLMQVFMIEAMAKYAELTCSSPAGYMEDHMVSEQAWRGCAEEYLRKLAAQQGRVIEIPQPRQPLTLEERLDQIVKEAREAGYAITYWSPEELEEFPGADASEMIDLAVQRGNDYLEDFRKEESEVSTFSVCADCAVAIGTEDRAAIQPPP